LCYRLADLLSLHPFPTRRSSDLVFLPAAVWAEKEGCHTNTERRVNLTRNVLPPYADSKPDFWIFNEMAKRFEDRNQIHFPQTPRSEEHTSELQSRVDLVCRLLLE